MVTLLEWQAATDPTVFENINNHKRITKFFLADNLRRIEQQMIKQYANKREGPTKENVHRIQDLIAATLENFEIVDMSVKTTKDIDNGIEMPVEEAKHKKAKDGKGEFCFKCGLQKIDTQIVEKKDEFIRVCKECLGV